MILDDEEHDRNRMMIGRCPFCGAEYEILEGVVGCKGQCPNCGEKFVVGKFEESNANTNAIPKGIACEISQGGSQVMENIKSLIVRILADDRSVTQDEKEMVKKIILEEGLCPFFYTSEEMFPSGDLSESEDEWQYCDESLMIKEKLDNCEYVDIAYDEMKMYLAGKLRTVQVIDDIPKLLKHFINLYRVFEEDKGCLSVLAQLMGDLLFVMGEYNKALLCYDKAVQYRSWNLNYCLLSDAIFNTFYKLKKNPPAKYLDCFNDYCILTESYIEKRLRVEYENSYKDFFEWALSKGISNNLYYSERDSGVFDCVFFDSTGSEIRKKLNLSSFVTFFNTNAIMEFRKTIYSEEKAFSRLLTEIKNKDKLLHIWNDVLDWYKRFKISFPKEEVVFHYRTPWLWKFHLDLFFPQRQLAIVFKEGTELCEHDFKDGRVGLIQYEKEWSRVLRKSETRYGIKIIRISLNHPQELLCDFLRGTIGE